MESDDEFESQLKRQQRFSIEKENQNPNIFSSPLNEKLEQVSFLSSDFQDPLSEQRSRNLVGDAGDQLLKPKKSKKKKMSQEK